MAIAALLVAVATLALWISSFRWQGTYRFTPVTPPDADASPLVGRPGEWRYQWAVSYGGGAFQVLRLHAGVNEVKPAGWSPGSEPYELSRGPRLPATADVRLLGVRYFDCPRTYSTGGTVQYWSWGFRYVTIPGWLAVLILAGPSVGWLIHRRRQLRRAMRGHCLACGYDLRGTPARCPECGAIPAAHDLATGGSLRHDRRLNPPLPEDACASPSHQLVSAVAK